MLEKRRPTALLIALALLPAAQGAAALGWARADQAATLGQPLAFSATLRLDPGDEVAAECVRAEVVVGESQLPPGTVRVDARRSADALTMRVHTDAAIEEPVVTVTLAIGCPPRLSRRFVLFADPPELAATQRAAAVAQAAPVEALPPPPALAPPPAVAPSPAPRAAPPDLREPAEPRPARTAPDAPVREARPAPRPAAEEPAPRPRRSAAAPLPRPAEAAPRLRLDPVEPAPARSAQAATPRTPAPTAAADTAAAATTATAASAVEDAIAAVVRAASAAAAAAASASAAAARIATLERTVTRLQGEADASRRLVVDLQRRLDAAGDSRLTMPLALTIAALLALAAWLWWRVRSLEQERQLAWRLAATEAPVTATPTPSVPTVPAPPAVAPRPAPAEPPLVTAEIAMPPRPASRAPVEGPAERTQVLPTGSRHDEVVAREVSIEELLDLEQQAEFFVVLGQEESAIDLLVQHLRESGGGSPLPYLKLLEIYRRRGDHDAYERTRTRFNQRFNAYAPDWDADLAQGRALEDYPGVLPRLQQAWARPLDAMAELEALLFRKSRGELFDLPAYREVLFLYSLARDLLDREAADSGTVDVLLPLAEGESEFGVTTPHPYFSLEREPSAAAAIAPRAQPTPVDLDLDLSLPAPPPQPPRN